MQIIIRDETLRQRVIEHIRWLNVERPWIIEIKRHVRKRSLSQNALYWKWIGIIANETGNDNDMLHEFFKRKFLTPMTFHVGGEQFEHRTTTKLPTDQFSAYMDKVNAFAGAELGIMLPQPEELLVP